MLDLQQFSFLIKERCLIGVDNPVDQSPLETFHNVTDIVNTGRGTFIPRHGMGLWNRYPPRDEDEVKNYKLGDPSEEESWALFRSKTLPEGDGPEGDGPSQLKKVFQYIFKKCEGLPEALDFFSRHLRNKKERNDKRERWMISLFDLPHEVDLFQQVLKIVNQDDRLGSCLLYLSIFPENSLISCTRVSRLWAAEGFLYDGSDCDLGRAVSFLQELLDRKWIHPVETRSDGGLSTFRMDSLVREIIVSLSDHRNLVTISSEGSTNWPERVRCLSVQRGTVKDLNEEKLSELHSLFVFDVSSNKDETITFEASPLETSKNSLFPLNFKLLKVLDLTGAPLQIAPDALFELIFLRYLSLRDTSIEVIPGSIGRLTHLEFLDLKQSLVTELPKEAEGLERIRHILIYHHEKDPLMESYNLIGFKASCRIGGLKCLEKLCFVESEDSMLAYLGNMTELRRLGITKLRAEHGKLLCCSLEKLKLLESLNVHAFDEDEIIDLHHLSSPPVSLKRLYLHGRLNKLPNWISTLCHLTKIVLRWSHMEGATQQEEDFLATLGKLPNLVELELRRAYNGRELDFKKEQFPKLKILLLDGLWRLRSMSLAKGTMPCLEDLTISRCQWLERIPSGIEHVATLQKLEFFEMSPEFYEMVPDDYRNKEGKPEVYFTQWRPGQWKTIPLVLDECDEGFADEHCVTTRFDESGEGLSRSACAD